MLRLPESAVSLLQQHLRLRKYWFGICNRLDGHEMFTDIQENYAKLLCCSCFFFFLSSANMTFVVMSEIYIYYLLSLN